MKDSILLIRIRNNPRHERLTFTGRYEYVFTQTKLRQYKNLFCEFRCDCGVIKNIPAKSVLDGHSKSCGCYNTDRITSHKMTKTKLYRKWMDMKTRCLNPRHKHYNRYGGRGIGIYEGWINSFEEFSKWAYQNGYNDKLSLERNDNNAGYTPENCSWITMKQQAQNRNNNQKYKYKGELLTISAISTLIGINRASVNRKLIMGMSVDEIVNTHTTYNKSKNKKQQIYIQKLITTQSSLT